MTQKRFKKLLMSKGISRNFAHCYIRLVIASNPSVKAVAGRGTLTPEAREIAKILVFKTNGILRLLLGEMEDNEE